MSAATCQPMSYLAVTPMQNLFGCAMRYGMLGVITLIFVLQFSLPGETQECEGNDRDLFPIDYTSGHFISARKANDNLNSRVDCYNELTSKILKNQNKIPKIIGGHQAFSRNFREVVRIDAGSITQFCTGVIISKEFILTAGHCSCATDYQIKLQFEKLHGEIDYLDLKMEGAAIRFPRFNCLLPPGLQPGRDLALFRYSGLQFKETSPGNYQINPIGYKEDELLGSIVLPNIRPAIQLLADEKLKSLYVVGFGRTENGKSEEMMAAYIPLLSRFCQFGRIYASVCAMYREFSLARVQLSESSQPVDSCQGDSGGPAYFIETKPVPFIGNLGLNVSQKSLVGIVSRAIRGVRHEYSQLKCGGGGIYTAVGTRRVINWLKFNGVEFVLGETDGKGN